MINSNQFASLPTLALEYAPLSTKLSGTSGWVDISSFKTWSVFIAGLEASGSVLVEVANGVSGPANGKTLATLTPDGNGNAYAASDGTPWHWLRLTKTAASDVSLTGTTDGTTAVITDVSSVTGIVDGQPIAGAGIPGGATVVSFDGVGGTVTISAPTTAAHIDEAITVATSSLTTGTLHGRFI